MIFNNKTSKNLLYSTSSAAIAELCTLPIDTVKVYIQANNLPGSDRIKPLTAVHTIYKNHGLNGFYRSWIPSTLRQTAYTGIRIGLYDNWLHNNNTNTNTNTDKSNIMKPIMGGFTGLVSSLIASPFDFLKTKLQHQPQDVSKLVRTTYNDHGVRGFFNGWVQTSQRSVLISSLQLPIFFSLQESFDHKISKFKSKHNVDISDNTSMFMRTTSASIITSIIVTGVVYPIDLAKSLIMTSNSSNIPSKTHHILARLAQTNGIVSFYRGISVSIMRSIPHFFITSITYEYLKNLSK
jgi:hypothetical protein